MSLYVLQLNIVFFVCRPSTFAQAAKLTRMAAAEEKELLKSMCSIIVLIVLLLCFTKSSYDWMKGIKLASKMPADI